MTVIDALTRLSDRRVGVERMFGVLNGVRDDEDGDGPGGAGGGAGGGRGRGGAGRGGTRWLAITEEAVVPTDSGGRAESLNLLRAAAAAGIDLHVVVPGISAAEVGPHAAALRGARIVGVPRRTGPLSHARVEPYLFASRPLAPAFVAHIAGMHRTDPFDAVVAVSFRVAHMGIALAEALDLPLLVRPHNIESDYFAELASSAGRLRGLPYAVESRKLQRAEARVHASPRVTLFADIAEEDATRRAARTATPVRHVPPFLPPRRAAPAATRPSPPAGTGTVLFLGSLDNANNAGGIGWFAERCWPGLTAERPGAALHVVGRRAPAPLRDALVAAGAEVTVDAPDVAPHLAAADVFVNPVHRGAGINIKMVEAMAAGLPVVTTSVGARGLHWRDGEHVLVADGVDAFRAAVLGLLDDPARRRRLAEDGRRFVETELDGMRQISSLVAALPPRVPG